MAACHLFLCFTSNVRLLVYFTPLHFLLRTIRADNATPNFLNGCAIHDSVDYGDAT